MLDDLNFAQLKVNFDHALYQIPVQELRAYIRKSTRFLSVYEFVQTGPLAELVVKRFRSHRAVSKSDLAVYAEELKGKLAEIESGAHHHDKAEEERERIRRFLPELEAIIKAEDEGEDQEAVEVAAAVEQSIASRQARRLGKKRKAEESADRVKERDRARSEKRRRTRSAVQKSSGDSDDEGQRMEVEE